MTPPTAGSRSNRRFGGLTLARSVPLFVLAAYGVFIAGSLAWGMALDGYRPNRYDVAGAQLALVGVRPGGQSERRPSATARPRSLTCASLVATGFSPKLCSIVAMIEVVS